MQIVKPERQGWRDEELSRRHRLYGFDCPAVDVDFLMLEYNRGEPVALIEYKHENSKPISLNHPSYVAIRKLADAYPLPFWVARYETERWTFLVTPANEVAFGLTPKDQRLTELEFVKLLYFLREVSLPAEVAAQLHTVK